MAKEENVTTSAEETRALGRCVGESLRGGELLLLQGELGVGKTVFVKGLAEGIGSAAEVTSPTFVLEQIYEGRIVLIHIDLYRAGSLDLRDLDIDEALEEGAAVVIEWSEKLPDRYRGDALTISLSYLDDGAPDRRRITIDRP